MLASFGVAEAQTQLAEHPGSVHGILADSLTGKPIPFATISTFQQGKLIDGTLTDSLGHFAISNLSFGAYLLTFSAVGYRAGRTSVWSVSAEKPVMELGTVTIRQDVRNLQAVTVRGQKPLIEQRADGIIFNVESLPIIAGSDASDVLRKVPMLSVDANGGLSMRGSSNIRVFIDGKPSDIYASSVADALKAIPGESIVKVEVITHPSARYDAEGTDGVVNITTRRIRDTITNGKISAVLGNRSELLMGDMQSKFGKWLVKLDGYYQTYWNRNGSVLDRKTTDFQIVQQAESRQTGSYFFGGANVLYSLDSLNTINLGYRRRWVPFQTTTISDNFYSENGVLNPSFSRQTDTPIVNDGNVFTAGYTGTSKDKRKEFSALGTYFLFSGSNRYDLNQIDIDQRPYKEVFDSKTHNQDLIIQVDYTQSFRNALKWETGGKLTQKKLDSDSKFDIYNFDNQAFSVDPVRSNFFSYQSTIYALYTNLSVQLKKWQFMTGIRYERTDLGATFKQSILQIPSFNNLVPNLLISRNLAQKSTLKLSYSVKLVRPYFALLNPTINNSDSLNIQFGNPYLRPELTRRYQLNYARNGTRLFTDITLFYNHNQNSIESIRTVRPDGVVETTWQNIGKNARLGLSLALTWKPNPNVSLGTTLTTQCVRLESPALQQVNSGLMRELVLNYSHKLPKGYSIDFYGFFDANNIRLQGYRSGWKYYSLTFSKKSTNDRFNLSLRMDTPLTRYTFIREETTTQDFYQLQTYRLQNQNIRFTFSYKLGKKEIKSPRLRQAENPE